MVEDWPVLHPYVQPSPPFGGGGCFTANTMVWMSDSVPKEISKVAVGDMVYSWNFRLGKLERVSVIDVMEPRQSIVYKIELESGHDIEVTGGHPFCVEEQGWKVVSMEDYKKEVEDGNTWDSEEVKGEIKVGDYIMDVNNALLDQDLHESKVKSITKLEEQTVYHFGVDGESHNFFANGMMVHNFKRRGKIWLFLSEPNSDTTTYPANAQQPYTFNARIHLPIMHLTGFRLHTMQGHHLHTMQDTLQDILHHIGFLLHTMQGILRYILQHIDIHLHIKQTIRFHILQMQDNLQDMLLMHRLLQQMHSHLQLLLQMLKHLILQMLKHLLDTLQMQDNL